MPTPVTGIVTPTYSPSTWDDLAAMAAALEALGVPRFATTGARDAAIPSPVQGQVCAVAGVLQIFNGSWSAVTGSGGGGSGISQSSASVSFASGYAQYSSSYVTPTVVKTGNLVTLQGGAVACPAAFSDETYYTWATLPSGYYPASTHRLGLGGVWCASSIVPVQCRANISGALELVSSGALSGVEYFIIPTMSWLTA